MTRYVIIGDSIAGNSAAARIRALDPDGTITILSKEQDPYYSRCALMYYAMDHCSRSDIHIADTGHYRRMNATVVRQRAVGVDTIEHTVALEDGARIEYDKLLIATGADARKMGIEGEDAAGVHDFVTLQDAENIVREAPQCRRAVVTGGGLIGAEVAEVFHELGVPCDFFVRESYYYHNFCSNAQSRIIEDRFRQLGIRLHVRKTINSIEKDASGRIAAIVDDTGDRLECDMLVRSIGVEPAIGFLRDSGVATDTGVLADDRMKNPAEDVWTAGDCAEVRFPGEERTRIIKLWYVAQPQGWVAGENMTGGNVRYELPVQYQAAMFMDLDFCSYGEMPSDHNDLEEHSITAPNGVDSVMLVHDGTRLMGASLLGTALTKEDIEHLVTSQIPLAEAVATVTGIFGGTLYDRAPRSRITEHRPASRRPDYWPFGRRKTRRGWFELTGGF